jgi:hypothetical protein
METAGANRKAMLQADLILAYVTMVLAGTVFVVLGKMAAIVCAIVGGVVTLIVNFIKGRGER